MKNLRIMPLLLCLLFSSCEKNDTDVNALYRRWDFWSEERIYNENPGDPNSSSKRDTRSFAEDGPMFYKFHVDNTFDSHLGPGMFDARGDSLYLDLNGSRRGYKFSVGSRELKLINTFSRSDYYQETTLTLRAR
ncbi:hypothetical protein [Sphingobacterium corticibacter]|uniref:Lipocalin-like domain-containing protein n=1 Tax=Sphingobacterium corticibacter TaxID=2171749 RepID=A0A2T8HHH3_9SPHI|nr:hypothetical protein [Sphingobacterium corticibacter]PVH24889.1 hypothetical protein DC487_12295 [Sphingobacterium corticibacter]